MNVSIRRRLVRAVSTQLERTRLSCPRARRALAARARSSGSISESLVRMVPRYSYWRWRTS
eukprot:1856471-Prorocentrum_lima.AAC.1